MEVNQEELGTRDKILKELKFDEKEDDKIKNLNKGFGEWEA